jgi:hypothetical protein
MPHEKGHVFKEEKLRIQPQCAVRQIQDVQGIEQHRSASRASNEATTVNDSRKYLKLKGGIFSGRLHVLLFSPVGLE